MLPEVQIKKILDYLLSQVSEDIIYEIFSETLGSYDFAENAKALFLKNIESDRLIETHIFFNHNRAHLPTIHINLPSENMGGDNGINWETKEEPLECKDENLVVSEKSYSSKYNIIFTSSNTFEVLIMYTLIKALIQGNIELLELNGIRNVKLSGSDIIFNEGFMPQNIYSRAISIDFIYTFRGVKLTKIAPLNRVIFKGEKI